MSCNPLLKTFDLLHLQEISLTA